LASADFTLLMFLLKPEKLGLKLGGGNGAEGMGKSRLVSQNLNPALKARVKSSSREEAVAQSPLRLNIRLFWRVVRPGRWHHDVDTRLSPPCYFCCWRISSELSVAAQLAKVEPMSPPRQGFRRVQGDAVGGSRGAEDRCPVQFARQPVVSMGHQLQGILVLTGFAFF